MIPRTPHPLFPQEQEPPRANPWGGGPISAPPIHPAFESPRPPANDGILNLQCPRCRAGLKLRSEHIGINGACVECGVPIRATSYSNGQVIVELIDDKEGQGNQPVREPESVTIDLQPTIFPAHPTPEPEPAPAPSTPTMSMPAAPPISTPQSIWQQTSGIPEPSNPETDFPQQPTQAAPQTHAEPPVQVAEPPASPWNNPGMFQPGSAGKASPPPMPQMPQFSPEPPPSFGQPAFPSPNGVSSMPWTNAMPQPPVSEQDGYQSFRAATAFDFEEPEEAPAVPVSTGPPVNVTTGSKKSRLGRSGRKPTYGFLKVMAGILVLAGIGYGAFLMTPKEKVDQLKHWVSDFVKPALDVLHPDNSRDIVVEPSATPSEAPNVDLLETAPAQPVATPDVEPDLPLPAKVEPVPQSVSEPVSDTERVERGGTAAIRAFYSTPVLKDRTSFLLTPEKTIAQVEAYYSETPKLPSMESVVFRKAIRGTESGRWFGVFEVDESDDDQLHRWIAVEDEKGEFKLDWAMYEQTITDGLQRFLDDPTLPTREFRVSLKVGETVPEKNNPWNSEAIGIFLQSPFDSQPARPIVLKKSDFEGLGIGSKLTGDAFRLARIELSWVPSDYDPQSRVPVISRLIGWGGW